jgi:hypothetical protein
VPLVGDLDRTDDDRDASVVEIDGQGLAVSLSQDGGLTWQELPLPALPGSLDLTPQASGTYGYLLKITLNVPTACCVDCASPRGSKSRRPRCRVWDRAATGWNTARGITTGCRPACAKSVRRPATRRRCWNIVVDPPADYDPQRQTARIRGP